MQSICTHFIHLLMYLVLTNTHTHTPQRNITGLTVLGSDGQLSGAVCVGSVHRLCSQTLGVSFLAPPLTHRVTLNNDTSLANSTVLSIANHFSRL